MDRIVYHNEKGWANKRIGAKQPEKYYPTQQEAINAARGQITNNGGGELSINRKDNGRIRDKNTIPPGNDPCPPKDKR